MRRIRFTLAAALVLAGSIVVTPSSRAAEAPSSSAAGPQKLVDAALAAEIGGAADDRQALLAQAMAEDAAFAPARWQAGFVRWNDQWLTPDDVALRAGSDKTIAEYRRRRAQMVDKADDHRALARWCHNNKLPAEARAHWLKAYEFEPDDEETQHALGLQPFNGALLTREQIATAKRLAHDRQHAIGKYKPLVTQWIAAFEHGGEKRQKAADEVAAFSDPSAIAALAPCFAPIAHPKKSRGLATAREPLQLALVSALGRMQHPSATSALVEIALQSQSPSVRDAAAAELKKRPLFTFVPLLIAAVPAGLKTRTHVISSGNGQLVRRSEVVLQGRDFEYSVVNDVIDQPVSLNPYGATGLANQEPQQTTTEIDGAAPDDRQAKQYEMNRKALTARIGYVLERTTGYQNVNDPALWERQWNDYNGWYSTPYTMRPYRNYCDYSYSYTPLYFNPYLLPSGNYRAPTSGGTTTLGPRITETVVSNPQHFPTPRSHMCFPAGTPISTLDGLRPIETLRPGDRVLAQDVRSGELDYRVVQDTTLRPAMPLVKLTLDDETIRVTAGHPCWVVGSGWRTAKFLKSGDRLHTTRGAVSVVAVDRAPPEETYNLVVDDWHNYFVGRGRILVHDNSPLESFAMSLPGAAEELAAPDAATAQAAP